MPRGTTKRRPITITALLDAALDLFAEQGYGATSIPDICARAGLTKGAFYSNFADKEALFLALLDRSWARRAEWIRRAMTAGGPLPGEADRSGSVPDAVVDRQWTLVSVEFSLHAIRRPAVARLLVEHERRVRAELAVLVTEALERAGRVPTVPVDELARMVVAVSEGNDLQVLTDAAGGAAAQAGLGPRAVTGLLSHFSRPLGSAAAPRTVSRS
jgi:AcrR family transcriptional regulator